MDADKLRHIKISWELLEHKFRYYMLSAPILQDYEYDLLEKEYESLCVKLHIDNTVSNMVDYDMSRPCCMLVAEKLMPIKLHKHKAKKLRS